MNTSNTIAFLGPEGTFTQVAALNYFNGKGDLKACATIDDVFAFVEQEVTEYGVVPIENSTEGAVNNTQDSLINSMAKIVGEVVVTVEHHLLASSSDSANALVKIASHKQSLAQCRKWLLKNYPDLELLECASNAEAAKLAATNINIGAIAGTLAGKTYGLVPIARKIQDQSHNSTRFLVLANKETQPTGNDKTSVLIYAENKPGSLFRILEPFENLQISLTKIETRPSKSEAWAYVFFIDFEGHIKDELIQELFVRLKICTAELKVLGSYPAFEI